MDFGQLLGGGYRVPPWLLPPDQQYNDPTFGLGDISLSAPPPAGDPAKAAMDSAKDAGAAPHQGGGFFSGLGDRLAMAQAYLSGDPSQVATLRARQDALNIQRQELQLRQQAAQRTEEDDRNRVWGMKASGLFSNPQIAALGAHGSEAMQARVAPWDGAPGHQRFEYGPDGQLRQAATVPTDMMQNYAGLNGIDPTLGRAYAEKEAYPGPIATQPGGGVAGFGTSPAHWVVQPNDMAPAAQPGAGAGGTGGATGPGNNPGGLRYPGSTQFRNFQTPAAGIAAGQAQLGRYFSRGINTVRGIVETWAPRRSRGGDNSDESVNNYIGHVASRLGVSPDQPLPASAIPQIFAAQTEFETGHRGPSPRLSAGSARGAPQAPVQVNSPQEAAALPPGTRFRTPDGREGTRN